LLKLVEDVDKQIGKFSSIIPILLNPTESTESLLVWGKPLQEYIRNGSQSFGDEIGDEIRSCEPAYGTCDMVAVVL